MLVLSEERDHDRNRTTYYGEQEWFQKHSRKPKDAAPRLSLCSPSLRQHTPSISVFLAFDSKQDSYQKFKWHCYVSGVKKLF